jgi:hypothetical protein
MSQQAQPAPSPQPAGTAHPFPTASRHSPLLPQPTPHLYVMPPSMWPFLTSTTLRWRRSSTRRAMYSRGMLGSCLLKMFFRQISLQRGQHAQRQVLTQVRSDACMQRRVGVPPGNQRAHSRIALCHTCMVCSRFFAEAATACKALAATWRHLPLMVAIWLTACSLVPGRQPGSCEAPELVAHAQHCTPCRWLAAGLVHPQHPAARCPPYHVLWLPVVVHVGKLQLACLLQHLQVQHSSRSGCKHGMRDIHDRYTLSAARREYAQCCTSCHVDETEINKVPSTCSASG